jgi:hypothetical protein
MTAELERRRQIERWIAWVRLFAVPFAVFEVGVISSRYPPGYERWAWIITAVLVVGAAGFWFLARAELDLSAQKILGFAALGLDAGVVAAYVVLYYSYEPDSPVRQILFLPVAEAAVRYGVIGGAVLPFALAPFLAWGEALRADRYEREFSADAVTLPLGIEVMVGVLVGWLASRLGSEAKSPRPGRPRPRSCATASADAATNSRR